MPQHQIIGFVLMGVAILDSVVGFMVVAPKAKNEKTRRILQLAFVNAGLILFGLGVAFHQGLIGG